jgi:hypothetical protein
MPVRLSVVRRRPLVQALPSLTTSRVHLGIALPVSLWSWEYGCVAQNGRGPEVIERVVIIGLNYIGWLGLELAPCNKCSGRFCDLSSSKQEVLAVAIEQYVCTREICIICVTSCRIFMCVI